MPILDITEYMDTHHGTPIEPPCAHQVVPLSDEYAESVPFHRATRCIRIASDVNCLIDIGNGGEMEPRSFLPAGKAEERIVHPDARFRLCAILAPVETACDSDRLTALIALVTNPKAAAQRKGELEKLSTATQRKIDILRKESKELAEAKARHDAAVLAFEKVSGDFKVKYEATSSFLVEKEGQLMIRGSQFDEYRTNAEAELKRRETDVTHREDAIADRVRTLSSDEAKVSEMRIDLERRLNHLKAATG